MQCCAVAVCQANPDTSNVALRKTSSDMIRSLSNALCGGLGHGLSVYKPQCRLSLGDSRIGNPSSALAHTSPKTYGGHSRDPHLESCVQSQGCVLGKGSTRVHGSRSRCAWCRAKPHCDTRWFWTSTKGQVVWPKQRSCSQSEELPARVDRCGSSCVHTLLSSLWTHVVHSIVARATASHVASNGCDLYPSRPRHCVSQIVCRAIESIGQGAGLRGQTSVTYGRDHAHRTHNN